MSDSSDIHEKIVQLESLVAHLQHEFDQLNAEVIEQNRVIETLQSAHLKLEHQIESLADDGESRNPEQEKPPHY